MASQLLGLNGDFHRVLVDLIGAPCPCQHLPLAETGAREKGAGEELQGMQIDEP